MITKGIDIAEKICDILRDAKTLEQLQQALCDWRTEVMCNDSPIQQYKCHVPIMFSAQSGAKTIYVDTCLQDEVVKLIRQQCVETIGCCCGHGMLTPYIQVAEHSAGKMIELGYERLSPDEYGNGQNCFKPKTIFPTRK